LSRRSAEKLASGYFRPLGRTSLTIDSGVLSASVCQRICYGEPLSGTLPRRVYYHGLKGGKGHTVGPVLQAIRVRYAVWIRHEHSSSFGDPVHASRQLAAFEVNCGWPELVVSARSEAAGARDRIDRTLTVVWAYTTPVRQPKTEIPAEEDRCRPEAKHIAENLLEL
jgi:hypothetical protein